jgi:hypothetical protein
MSVTRQSREIRSRPENYGLRRQPEPRRSAFLSQASQGPPGYLCGWQDPVQAETERGHIAGESEIDRLLRQRGGLPVKQRFQGKGGAVEGAFRLAGRIAGLIGFELGRRRPVR